MGLGEAPSSDLVVGQVQRQRGALQQIWSTPVSFIVRVPFGVTAWPLPGANVLLTTTAGIPKSGVPPLMAVLQPEWPASAVMLAREIVLTR